MLKKLFLPVFLALASLAPSQHITLSKAEKTHPNTDKFLYRINPQGQSAEYLGEVEVDGFSTDDSAVFSQIYKKAKLIGANAFSLQQEDKLNGTPAKFDRAHYRLSLYYSRNFPKQDNIAYIFSPADHTVRLRVDGKKISLQPRAYIKKIISYGGDNDVAAGNFLGSRIRLTAKEGQPVQFFMVSAFNVKSDQTGQGGINIKSGDIIGLERSFAEFLTLIYKEQKY